LVWPPGYVMGAISWHVASTEEVFR
jgi:hypothetical protein